MKLGSMLKSRELFFFHFILPHLINGVSRIEISREELYECLGFIDIEFLLCGLGPGWGVWTDAKSGNFALFTSLDPDAALRQFLDFKSTTTHHKKFAEIEDDQSNHPGGNLLQ